MICRILFPILKWYLYVFLAIPALQNSQRSRRIILPQRRDREPWAVTALGVSGFAESVSEISADNV